MVIDMNVLLKSRYLLIVLTLLMVHSTSVAASARSKPQPPVQVSIAPVRPGLASSNIKPGDVVEFRVSVLSSLDASEMRVFNSLDGGADLVSGDLTWTGQARKGEETSVTLTVRAPRKGRGTIHSKIDIYSGDVLIYSTKVVYEMGAPEKSKPAQPRGIRKDSKGKDVIEYR